MTGRPAPREKGEQNMSNKDGGPAFPIPGGPRQIASGMSLRDYFAAHAVLCPCRIPDRRCDDRRARQVTALDPRASPKYCGQQMIRAMVSMIDAHGDRMAGEIGKMFVENKNLMHAAVGNPLPLKDAVLDPELLLPLLDRAVQTMIQDCTTNPTDHPDLHRRYMDRIAAVRSAAAVIELQRAALEGMIEEQKR